MEMNIPSIGKVNAGLTTGIIGTVLGALNSGVFNGGGAGCSENTAVNRYELNTQRELIAKDAEIAFLKGRDAAKTDSLALYQYVDGRLRGIEEQIAQLTANISCMQQSIAALNSLTKTVIPIGNICPLPATATTTATT